MKQSFLLPCLALLAWAAALPAQNCQPTLTLYNGASTNILPADTDGDGQSDAGRATVAAASLVKLGYNPCGTGALSYRIRKSGFGTGVPTTTEVSFDCDETGTQLVEIWGGDSQDNWAWAETYVIIQPTTDACDNTPPSIPVTCDNDKQPPALLLLNGLAASLQPDDEEDEASLTVTASSLVLAKSDNCGGSIRLRMRKSGTGTGVPSTSAVTFGCDEEGTQLVEVWARDASGNWGWAETYVRLHDAYDACDHPVAPGCTPDLTPPNVLAIDGFSVNVTPGPNGPAALVRAKPFLRQRSDNCADGLTVRIGRDDGSTTPPTSTTLSFPCDELGTQQVVLWVNDEAGNWSRTYTYVIVQDNAFLCNTPLEAATERTMPAWKTALLTENQDKNAPGAAPSRLSCTLQPNPTSGNFAVRGTLDAPAVARLELYNAFGQKVRTLAERAELPAGEFRLDLSTGELPAGLYWCVLQSGGATITLPLVRE